MRKIFIILITAIFCAMSGFVSAEGVETRQINSMEIVKDCEIMNVAVLKFTQNGERVSVGEGFITQSDAEELLGFFSDDNLLYSGEVDEETLNGPERPEDGEIEIYLENGLNVYLTFDNKKILVEVIDVDNLISYCGWFTYRNENGYEQLTDMLDGLYLRAKPLEDAKREEEKQKAEAERTYIDDFEILYSCDVPDVTEWGICSYTKDNEKIYAVYSVYYNSGNKVKPLHFTEEKPVNNKVSFYYDKQIFTGGEKTYIRENMHPTTSYAIEVFPDGNGRINKAVITQVVTADGRALKSITADAKNIIETGKIPDGFFGVVEDAVEKEETENKNKDDNVKEDVTDKDDGSDYEDEEIEEDKPDIKDTENEVSADEDTQDIQQSPENRIRKRAQESGLVLTIGEKAALVKGERKENDVPPMIRNSRTMLPARFIGEGIGAEVLWDGEKREVTVSKDDIVIRIYIDSDMAYVNDKEEKLDSPAFIENDRTYIPLRFIAENFGADVIWDSESRMVYIAEKIVEN